mgnify:CR=1 FL=1
MTAFAAAGAVKPQHTYTTPTGAIPSVAVGHIDPKGIWATAKVFLGVTAAAALTTIPTPAYTMPQTGYTQPLKARESGGTGTMAPGGLISDATRDLSRIAQLPHNSEAMDALNNFILARPGVDVGAIKQIHALAASRFASPTGSAPKIEYEVVDEPSGPALFLTVYTQGIDFDEQMRRELALQEAIWANARLQTTKNYVVINAYDSNIFDVH